MRGSIGARRSVLAGDVAQELQELGLLAEARVLGGDVAQEGGGNLDAERAGWARPRARGRAGGDGGGGGGDQLGRRRSRRRTGPALAVELRGDRGGGIVALTHENQ
jgi:hypothetical protein